MNTDQIELRILELVGAKAGLMRKVYELRKNEPPGPDRNIKELELQIEFQKTDAKIARLFDELGTPKLDTNSHLPFSLDALNPSTN